MDRIGRSLLVAEGSLVRAGCLGASDAHVEALRVHTVEFNRCVQQGGDGSRQVHAGLWRRKNTVIPFLSLHVPSPVPRMQDGKLSVLTCSVFSEKWDNVL